MDLYLIVHLVASTFTVIDFSLSNEDVSALSDYNFIIRSVPSA